MKAYCVDCGTKMMPGFTTIVTPINYDCDEGGDITEFDEKLLPNWIDGVSFHGWWCSDCGDRHPGGYGDVVQ